MGRLKDRVGPSAAVVVLILASAAGMAALYLIANLFITLTATAPIVAGMLMLGLIFIASIAVAGFYSDTTDDKEETSSKRDPLTVLKERYARGEISEEEFEHQVSMLLNVNEIDKEKQKPEPATEQN